VEEERPEPTVGVNFKRPDPRELLVCGVRLDAYLTDKGQREALDITKNCCRNRI